MSKDLNAAPSLKSQIIGVIALTAAVVFGIPPLVKIMEASRASAVQTSARIHCPPPGELETLVVFVNADASGAIRVRYSTVAPRGAAAHSRQP